jgi:hypothetical protein
VRVPGQQQGRQRRLDHAAHHVGRQHHVLPSQPVGPDPARQQESDLRDGFDGGDHADVGRGPPTCKIAKTRAIWTSASPSEDVVLPIHISR